MKTFWKTTLIVAGLAFGAAAGSGAALAGTVHKQDSGKTSSKTKPTRMPPAVAIYRQNHPAQPSRPHKADRRQVRERDRDHRQDRVVRRDRREIHERNRDRERLWHERRERERYVHRNRERLWHERHERERYVHRDRRWDRGWARYDHRSYGYIPPRRHVFAGYGAQWMWWGGQYRPYNPPAAFRNCYPVVRHGWYHGRRARFGGTMCYSARGTYLLPNSTFIINIY
jgi:hypothetical protein